MMSFIKTFHHLSLHPPDLILVTDTALPTPDQPGAVRTKVGNAWKPPKPTLLVEALMDHFTETEIVPIPRRYWNDDAGEYMLTTFHLLVA